jgi:hypothetical protein
MRKVPPICVIVLSAAALTTCAKGGPVKATAPAAASVTVQKWFSVDKHDPWYWGCLVRVTPSHGPATHLRVDMEVAWLLTNECDDSTDLTLTFFRDGSQVDSPIEFQPVVNGVLKGKVKSMTVPEGGLRFKYSAQSGRHRKDPEIVIFP